MKCATDFLNHLQLPEIPPHLQNRVLAVAEKTTLDFRPTTTDLLWESPSLRLVWTGAIAILLLLNFMPTQHPELEITPEKTENASAIRDPFVRELMEIQLPRLTPEPGASPTQEISKILAELDQSAAESKSEENKT